MYTDSSWLFIPELSDSRIYQPGSVRYCSSQRMVVQVRSGLRLFEHRIIEHPGRHGQWSLSGSLRTVVHFYISSAYRSISYGSDHSVTQPKSTKSSSHRFYISRCRASVLSCSEMPWFNSSAHISIGLSWSMTKMTLCSLLVAQCYGLPSVRNVHNSSFHNFCIEDNFSYKSYKISVECF